MDLTPEVTVVPAKSGMFDLVNRNPYLHFIMSEMWTALAAIAVYGLFRFGAYATQHISDALPLTDSGPATFLEATLSWGGALAAGATFIIISLYQIVVLIKRLWEGFKT